MSAIGFSGFIVWAWRDDGLLNMWILSYILLYAGTFLSYNCIIIYIIKETTLKLRCYNNYYYEKIL
jgi:hypothetical protein